MNRAGPEIFTLLALLATVALPASDARTLLLRAPITAVSSTTTAAMHSRHKPDTALAAPTGPPCGINGSDGQVVQTLYALIPSAADPMEAAASVSLTLAAGHFQVEYDFSDSVIMPGANTVIHYSFFSGPESSMKRLHSNKATPCSGHPFFIRFGTPSASSLPAGSTITISGLLVTIVQPVINSEVPIWSGDSQLSSLCAQNEPGGARLVSSIFEEVALPESQGVELRHPDTLTRCPGLQLRGPDTFLPFSFVCTCPAEFLDL